MDTSSSEVGDVSDRLSLSLVSYSSDVEDPDLPTDSPINASSHTLICEPATDVTLKSGIPSSYSTEDELIKAVANKLGLSGISEEKLDHLTSAYERMKASQLKYLQSKMIFDAIVDVARTPSDLPPETAERVQQALDHLSLTDFVAPVYTDCPDGTDGIFGISKKHLEEFLPCELSAIDIKRLQEAMEKKIVLKHQKLVALSKRHADVMASINKPIRSTDSECCVEQKSTHEMLSLRQKLDHEISMNHSLMRDFDDVLSLLTKLKLEDFDRANNDRIEAYQSRCALLKIQVQYLNDQIQSGIQSEDSHITKAYACLQEHLNAAIVEGESKLSQLQKRDAEYKKLQGTHFDRLLKEYRELKAQISQKEYALNLM